MSVYYVRTVKICWNAVLICRYFSLQILRWIMQKNLDAMCFCVKLILRELIDIIHQLQVGHSSGE